MVNYRWVRLLEALSLMILAIFAMCLPHFFTSDVAKMLGITFVVAGLVQFLRIFVDRLQPRSILYFFIAALYGLFGVVYWIHPILSMLSMGLILMGFLMVDGLAKFVLAYELYPSKISIGFVLNGILSMALAGWIWKSWPSTAFWVPGAFSGLNLLFYGSSLLSLALSEPRRRHRRADD